VNQSSGLLKAQNIHCCIVPGNDKSLGIVDVSEAGQYQGMDISASTGCKPCPCRVCG
jgi:hypothetical protein